MKKSFTILFFIVFSFLTSCGKDQLNSNLSTSREALENPECKGYVPSTPVCGYLKSENAFHDYMSKEFAECLGAEVKNEGHCNCEENTVGVCTENGVTMPECEAKEKKLVIAKYVPCYAKEM